MKTLILVSIYFEVGHKFYHQARISVDSTQPIAEYNAKAFVYQNYPDAYNLSISSNVLKDEFVSTLKDYLNE